MASFFRSDLLLGSALAAGLLVAGTSGASAVTFTLDPAALGISGISAFSADNYTGADYAQAIIQNTGPSAAFTETGILQFTNFQVGSTQLAPGVTGLNNGANKPNSYGLYKLFSAAGVLDSWNGGAGAVSGTFGHFNTAAYSFVFDPTNDDKIAYVAGKPTLVDTLHNDITIGSGSLRPPPNSVGVQPGGAPFADVRTSPVLTSEGMMLFTAPPGLEFQEDSFTNTTTEYKFTNNGSTTTLQIGGPGTVGPGSTSGSFAVPEPATLAVVGASLIGLGLARRKRRG